MKFFFNARRASLAVKALCYHEGTCGYTFFEDSPQNTTLL
jgi:hypothetical protein